MIMLQQLKELHDIQRHGRLDELTALLTKIQEESREKTLLPPLQHF